MQARWQNTVYDMSIEFKHISVLYDECIDGLAIKKDGVYVDGTIGGGGHSFGICEQLSDKGVLIGKAS